MLKKINPHKLYLSIIVLLLMVIFITSERTFVSDDNGVFMIGVNYGDIKTAIEKNL
jgi:hypothetical protein